MRYKFFESESLQDVENWVNDMSANYGYTLFCMNTIGSGTTTYYTAIMKRFK